MEIIDIKTRLPKDDNWVICLNSKGFLGIARYYMGEWYSYSCSHDRDKKFITIENDNIVAWIEDK